MNKVAQKLIIALDDLDADAAFLVVERTKAYSNTFKVGLNLFCGYGPKIVKDIKALGVEVFLDLKLHDIPMQVSKAVDACIKYEPKFLTVHASGGLSMLQEASRASQNSSTVLLSVSVLTSMNQNEYRLLGFKDNVAEGVMRFASLAYEARIKGFVCSPHEAKMLKATFQNQCILVCPGIRSVDDKKLDQSRTMTACEAVRAGADFIVVGRPITKAADQVYAAQQIYRELEECLIK